MYRTGVIYKFETKNFITYTGYVIEEDSLQIKVKTIRGEELIFTKDSLARSTLMDRTENEKPQKSA